MADRCILKDSPSYSPIVKSRRTKCADKCNSKFSSVAPIGVINCEMRSLRKRFLKVCKRMRKSILKACCVTCEDSSESTEGCADLDISKLDESSPINSSLPQTVCSLEFHNGLPYELVLEVIPNTGRGVKAVYTVKAGEFTQFDANNDSTLVMNLCYLENLWTFSERIYSLEDFQECEFVSVKGETIVLRNSSFVGVDGKLSYTISSPVWIYNETQFDVAYLQQLSTNQYIKTYQPTEQNFHQPILLDCYLNQIALACADRIKNRENWTRLPLDESGPLEVFYYGSFHLINSFINQTQNIFGTTVLLTEVENDPYPSLKEEDREIYVEFMNDLSCDTFLEIISNGTVINTAQVDAHDALMKRMPSNAMIAVHLTHLNEKWTYRETYGTSHQQEHCKFESETGKSLHVNYCSISLARGFVFRIYGTLAIQPPTVSLFMNFLPCVLHLEVFEDNKLIQDEFILDALNGSKLWQGSKDSTFSLQLTYKDEKWMFREKTETFHTLQKWKFTSDSGKTCYAMIDSIEHEDSKFQFRIKELLEVNLDS